MTRTPPPFPGAAAAWQADLDAQLAPGEPVVATLEPNLDAHLAFAAGRLVLTLPQAGWS